MTLPYTSVKLKMTKKRRVRGKNFWKVSPKMGTTEKVPITWLNELFSMFRMYKKFKQRAALTREKLLGLVGDYKPE